MQNRQPTAKLPGGSARIKRHLPQLARPPFRDSSDGSSTSPGRTESEPSASSRSPLGNLQLLGMQNRQPTGKLPGSSARIKRDLPQLARPLFSAREPLLHPQLACPPFRERGIMWSGSAQKDDCQARQAVPGSA
jgi:hypothetical protein